jgi:hypothetical protein
MDNVRSLTVAVQGSSAPNMYGSPALMNRDREGADEPKADYSTGN